MSLGSGSGNGWSYELSKQVFDYYFAPNLKIIKTFDKENRFEVCNPSFQGCYRNPSYRCVILANDTGLCFAIREPDRYMSFQIITNPGREKLISGKDVFGFGVYRDVTKHDYNMNLVGIGSVSKFYSESNRSLFLNNCISKNPYPTLADGVTVSTSDREWWCTFLIIDNGWKIPKDYPIKF